MLRSSPSVGQRSFATLLLVFLMLPVVQGCGRVSYARDAERLRDGRVLDAGMDTTTTVDTAACGDGVVAGDEVCDDGNTEDGDGCAAGCDAREICGDGTVTAGEACDDGNGVSGDGCENDCKFSCTDAADCDDGQDCNGAEVCTADRACASGVPQADGTSCEMANVCRSGSCAPVTCGDTTVDVGEDCDDGNTVDGDGCDNDCSFSCVMDRDCDDGNPCSVDACGSGSACDPTVSAANGTSCDRDADPATIDVCLGGMCLRSICGDSYVDRAVGEDCDDGNTVNGDGCDNDCAFSCTVASDCDDGKLCNGTEICDVGPHTCERGTPPSDGTPCPSADGTGGFCGGGVCNTVMTMDSGMMDSALPDTTPADTGADSGMCPLVPSAEMPLTCFKRCTDSSDCTLVQSSCCCPCTMGGTSEAINSRYTTEWSSRRAMMCIGTDCRGILCPGVFVCPPPPTCIAGQCDGSGAS